MEGYILWAVSTSAESPIVNGRFRPISGNGPQARTGSQPHDRVDHNIKATFVAVRWGLDHGVGLRLLPPFGLRPRRVRWRQGRCSSLVPPSVLLSTSAPTVRCCGRSGWLPWRAGWQARVQHERRRWRRRALPGWSMKMLFILPNPCQGESVPGEAARGAGEAFTTLLT